MPVKFIQSLSTLTALLATTFVLAGILLSSHMECTLGDIGASQPHHVNRVWLVRAESPTTTSTTVCVRVKYYTSIMY